MRLTKMSDVELLHEDGYTTMMHRGMPIVQFNQYEIIITKGYYGNDDVLAKKRMNQANGIYNLGIKVYQRAGNWFILFNGKDHEFNDNMMRLNRHQIENQQ